MNQVMGTNFAKRAFPRASVNGKAPCSKLERTLSIYQTSAPERTPPPQGTEYQDALKIMCPAKASDSAGVFRNM